MIIEFRALYFEADKEPFIPLERASLLFDIEFEDNEFPEEGIHANSLLPVLNQGGWKINVVKPSETDKRIKVFLTHDY
jgi:hypothetical protein